MSKKRVEVVSEDQWNLETLCSSLEEWKRAFSALKEQEVPPYWPSLTKWKGCLGEGASQVQKTLAHMFAIEQRLERLYTYAHLRHDEDLAEEEAKKAYQLAMAAYHQYAQEVSWVQPELLSLSKEILHEYLRSPELRDYVFFLEKIIRLKPHTLSPESEQLLALSGQALETARRSFSALNDADFRFPPATDSSGSSRELTHGQYQFYLQDRDRALRKSAFSTYHQKFHSYKNTLCELLQGQMQQHLFEARARNYSSCLEAALYPNQIDQAVYHSLIETVNKRLPSLHRYMRLRKRLLGVSELHLYDLYVPLTAETDIRMDYRQAEEIVIKSVAPLGEEYQQILAKGLLKERWVDRYENENKRSGAYSSGCYDSFPYILMNYKSLLRDVFVLAHEAGHSMHSHLSHRYQAYHDSKYPIFLAEVASTFNEDLLIRLLLKQCGSFQEKIFLITQKIEDIRTTLFRQTLFAEFELLLHQYTEQQRPLTPALLQEQYLLLNQKYFGPDVIIDPEIAMEWARIPHFYYNFYVYQYATGLSAALTLARGVVEGAAAEQEAYLSFLRKGGSRYPLDILQDAGIDMRTKAPIEAAIDQFDGLIGELETLTSGEANAAVISSP